jgi:hypothetical protein
VATEVVELVAPPPSSGADNLGGGRMAKEAIATQVATELLVEAAPGGGDVVAVSVEQIVPSPPLARGHETEVAAAETPVPAVT